MFSKRSTLLGFFSIPVLLLLAFVVGYLVNTITGTIGVRNHLVEQITRITAQGAFQLLVISTVTGFIMGVRVFRPPD